MGYGFKIAETLTIHSWARNTLVVISIISCLYCGSLIYRSNINGINVLITINQYIRLFISICYWFDYVEAINSINILISFADSKRYYLFQYTTTGLSKLWGISILVNTHGSLRLIQSVANIELSLSNCVIFIAVFAFPIPVELRIALNTFDGLQSYCLDLWAQIASQFICLCGHWNKQNQVYMSLLIIDLF